MRVKEHKINKETHDLEMQIVLIGVITTSIGLFALLQILSYGEHTFVVGAISLFLATLTAPLWDIFTPQTYITSFVLLIAGFLYFQF